VASKSPLILRAHSEEDQHKWLDKLNMACQKKKVSVTNDETLVTTMEAVLDACVVTDDKCNILGFNKAAERMFCMSIVT
jgi:hypothetical protein